jgi:hypothetical protein
MFVQVVLVTLLHGLEVVEAVEHRLHHLNNQLEVGNQLNLADFNDRVAIFGLALLHLKGQLFNR